MSTDVFSKAPEEAFKIKIKFKIKNILGEFLLHHLGVFD